MSQHISVSSIWQQNERQFAIQWSDRKEQVFDVVDLRRQCPCAQCVDEHTGKRTLKPSSINESIRPTQIDSVGSYGLKVAFNDGHSTGIYTFDYLRSMTSQSPISLL